MNKSEFLMLQLIIEEDIAVLTKLEKELAGGGLYPEITSTTYKGVAIDDLLITRMLTSILHDYYNAIEHIFKNIAQNIDESLPKGSDWHSGLISQMSRAVPGTRPAVITKKTLELISELKGLRHVIRAKYGLNINAKKIYLAVNNLHLISKYFKSDLNAFIKTMNELYATCQGDHVSRGRGC
ncbi:hypothetical protein M1N64_01770 [Peptococcaceae bacterium]|nr:hypothetical protein [Peptococcaceae bacterium]